MTGSYDSDKVTSQVFPSFRWKRAHQCAYGAIKTIMLTLSLIGYRLASFFKLTGPFLGRRRGDLEVTCST